MKKSYLDYAMSVIVARSLPDARDGLKPVHRGILYSMNDQGHTPATNYVKTARVLGDVTGKHHPPGDQTIYDAMSPMAQDFSMRTPLVDSPALPIRELINLVPRPDFPTGGLILGRQGIRAAYHLGRGSVMMRGKVAIEPIRKEREAIIITEIPYQVNKATMVERIAEPVKEKKLEGIGDLRHDSDRS